MQVIVAKSLIHRIHKILKQAFLLLNNISATMFTTAVIKDGKNIS